MSSKWTEADVPDQTGRVAIVTGSNTGLGFETRKQATTGYVLDGPVFAPSRY